MTAPCALRSGKNVDTIATRRPSVTFTCRSSRGSYQTAGVLITSPANARVTMSRTPFAAAISSRSTQYSGGGSEPNRSRKA